MEAQIKMWHFLFIIHFYVPCNSLAHVNTGVCEDTFSWEYLWCQDGGVVPCQMLSWSWRRSGPHRLEETGSPRIRDLPLSIADLRTDRCLLMLRARLLNSTVSSGFRRDTGRGGCPVIDFWLPVCHLLQDFCTICFLEEKVVFFEVCQPQRWSWWCPKFG